MSVYFRMEPMSVLVPRLWPFLSHSTSSVRKSTLLTLKTLTQNTSTYSPPVQSSTSYDNNGCTTSAESTPLAGSCSIDKFISVDSKNLTLNFGVKEWPAQLLQEAMRHIYQRVLVEHLADIQAIAEDVWLNLVTSAELSALLHAACPYVAAWMCLAMQPARLAFDPVLMVYAKALTHPQNVGKVSSRREIQIKKMHRKLLYY